MNGAARGHIPIWLIKSMTNAINGAALDFPEESRPKEIEKGLAAIRSTLTEVDTGSDGIPTIPVLRFDQTERIYKK